MNKKPRQPCKRCQKPVKDRHAIFCSSECCGKFQREELWRKWDVEGIQSKQPRTIKAYITHKRGHKCEICGIENWNGEELVLTLDHIDGDSRNNLENNLRLVCPNCDSQLPTYKGRNIGNGRHSRRQRYKEGKSY